MKSFETTLTERGITTVPKTLREALGAPGGGRLIWRLTQEGALEVRLKHVYQASECEGLQLDELGAKVQVRGVHQPVG